MFDRLESWILGRLADFPPLESSKDRSMIADAASVYDIAVTECP